ncbi:unnamed protein product [Vicia faba]|uniref:Secreted protein n=1 Tax=Vicia faba TaxID=3906 RepID=A0AAV0ZLF8_VICFA|nr:unnamed protein product [Vicia faba]
MVLRERFNVVRTVFLSNFFLLIFLLPLHGDGQFESGRFFIEEEHEIKKGNRATVGVASGLDVIEAILMIDCRKGVFWVVGGERVICDTGFVSFTETSTCFPVSCSNHYSFHVLSLCSIIASLTINCEFIYL